MASEDRITPIEDLRAGMKNVHCIFIVIDRGTQQKTKDGSTVRKCRVADKTGSIIFSVWNREGEAISTGDIIRLTKGYSSLWKGNLVLYCGKYGLVERLGDFTMVFSETPDMSTYVPPQAEGPAQQSPHSMSEMSPSSAQPPSIENHHQSSNTKHRHSIETMATVSAPSSSSSSSTHSNGHMNSKHAQRRHPSHDNHVTSHHNNALSVHHRHHPYSRQNTREHGWQ